MTSSGIGIENRQCAINVFSVWQKGLELGIQAARIRGTTVTTYTGVYFNSFIYSPIFNLTVLCSLIVFVCHSRLTDSPERWLKRSVFETRIGVATSNEKAYYLEPSRLPTPSVDHGGLVTKRSGTCSILVAPSRLNSKRMQKKRERGHFTTCLEAAFHYVPQNAELFGSRQRSTYVRAVMKCR